MSRNLTWVQIKGQSCLLGCLIDCIFGRKCSNIGVRDKVSTFKIQNSKIQNSFNCFFWRTGTYLDSFGSNLSLWIFMDFWQSGIQISVLREFWTFGLLGSLAPNRLNFINTKTILVLYLVSTLVSKRRVCFFGIKIFTLKILPK